MSIRKYINMQELENIFKRNIVPNIGFRHLDFGCGDGKSSAIESTSTNISSIFGYDIDTKKIQEARALYGKYNNLTFLDSEANLDSESFDSAGANFVFHEDTTIISKIRPYIIPNGKLLILDYNHKGKSRKEFKKSFCSDNEKRIIMEEGFDNCYAKHTSLNIEDCIKISEESGFKTLKTESSKNYFIYIGQKA